MDRPAKDAVWCLILCAGWLLCGAPDVRGRGAPPPPRKRAEVEAVLAKAPKPPAPDKLRLSRSSEILKRPWPRLEPSLLSDPMKLSPQIDVAFPIA